MVVITKVETVFSSSAKNGAGLRTHLSCGHFFDWDFDEDYHAVMGDTECPKCFIEDFEYARKFPSTTS